MASSKNVWKLVVDASSADDYDGPITHSRSKALDRLQPQSTKEGRKATTKDSSFSKDLEINNESSLTNLFYRLLTSDEKLKE